MATGTRPTGKVDLSTLPADMKVFHVIDRTICDSMGEYCEAGEEAALNEEHAQHYHRLHMIAVDLPTFGTEVDPKDAELAELKAKLTAIEAATATDAKSTPADLQVDTNAGASNANQSADGAGAEVKTSTSSNSRQTRA